MTETVFYTAHGTLDSSALAEYWYDHVAMTLFVKFRGADGRIAGYKNVSYDVVYDLISANSAGSYYARNIKNKYVGTTGDVEFESRTETPPVDNTYDPVVKADPKSFVVTFAAVMTTTVKADSIVHAMALFDDAVADASNLSKVVVKSIAVAK